jgi:hypothetical protein
VVAGWARVAAAAAELGGGVLRERPPCLDMAERGAGRRLAAHLDSFISTLPGS